MSVFAVAGEGWDVVVFAAGGAGVGLFDGFHAATGSHANVMLWFSLVTR